MNEPMVDGLPINYAGLPQRFRDGMRRYLENGIRPGAFISGVLANEFSPTVLNADDDLTLYDLRTMVRWLHCNAPGVAFGSTDALKSWIAKRRTP